MKMYFKNAKIYGNGVFTSADAIFDGISFKIFEGGINDTVLDNFYIYENCYILPGLGDAGDRLFGTK